MKSLLAALYSAAPRRVRSRLIEARLQRFVPLESALRVAVRHQPLGPYAARVPVTFERKAGVLAIGIDFDCLDRDLRIFNMVWKRLPVIVQIVSRASDRVRHARCDLSDGQFATSNEIAFCSADPATVLVPDRSFMTRRYYEPLRLRAKRDPWNWPERNDTLRWRGSATGIGEVANETMQVGDADLIQRVRLCLTAKAIPGIDVKLFARPEHFEPGSGTFERLERERIVGSFVPPDETAQGKFWFDVDGSTNAWSNLYTRLLMGCCVIKVASERGFRQWYYGDLLPWIHFVPVAADLSDLAAVAEWCLANDGRCEAIAKAGQKFALARTIETETGASVARVEQAFD